MLLWIYCIQSRDPSFHSWSSPSVTISKNKIKGVKNNVIGMVFIIIGVGIRITISTSKTKNKTANKKNRRENGIRALETGLNPHSKGLNVSRSFHWLLDIILIKEKIRINAVGIMLAKIKGNSVDIISLYKIFISGCLKL